MKHPVLHWPLVIEDSSTFTTDDLWGYRMATPDGHHDGFGDSFLPDTGYGDGGDWEGNGIGVPRVFFASRGF